MSEWQELIPTEIKQKYDIHNFNHAAEILTQAYPSELNEVFCALQDFSLSREDLLKGGGNESAIPKKLSSFLYPLGWAEVKISGDLLVRLKRRHEGREEELSTLTIENFVGGHNIDYVKGKIALDLEWNSKDQTFDRDLYAFRAFYECGIISCGILITRSESLNPIFSELGIKSKYGASTTWMGKLLPRIQARRHGGCPLLVIGITPNTIVEGGSYGSYQY